MARPHDHTSLGGKAQAFPPTEWTRLLNCPQRAAVLGELCERYWKPVYCYLRSIGLTNEEAKDLVQGFFTDKVLGQELIGKADREKGRFRSFLLRSVHNYAVSALRSSKRCVSLEAAPDVGTAADEPEVQFNRAWADQLLQEVLKELELECSARGKLIHWCVFRDWLLEPERDQDNRRMSDICRRYGVPDASMACHMVENVKRRFRAILRDRLALQAGPDTEAEEEIHRFIDVFSRRSART